LECVFARAPSFRRRRCAHVIVSKARIYLASPW
jgi:hypothetical protein